MKYKLIKPINQNYSPIEQILTNRGIPLEILPLYLNTTDEMINDPALLGEDLLRKAASILIQTIKNNNFALVVVDSDCDGFASSAILINYLYKIFPTWTEQRLKYVMHKGKEHGLNDHIDNILEQNLYSLIITPDSGTNDTEACEKLNKSNISVIILDHHLKEKENPYAVIINNQTSNYPNKQMSGAGITWQFCRYLDKLMNTNYADYLLDLVALALCGDMMSMTSIETKHLVNKGFLTLKNPFFNKLAQKNSFSMKGKINHTSVAFYIVPYINAICRSGTIEQKILVFKSMLFHEAFKEIVSTKRGHFLGDMELLVDQAIRTAVNVKARQTKAQDIGMEKLEEKIKKEHLLDHKVLLFLMEPGEIDKNVAGLAANKIMSKYQRPVCVLTKVEHEQGINFNNKNSTIQSKNFITYQGSARGCDKIGLDDFKEICENSGEIIYTIGHPNAFGAGIKQSDIQNFISKTDAVLADISDEAIYYVDYIYQSDNFNADDLLAIANMQDLWGKDVDESLVAIEHLKVTSNMVTVYQKKDNTLKISLPNGVSLMKFKATDEECFKLQNTFGYYEINVVGKPNINEWNGSISAQLFIQDYEIIDSNEWVF